MADFRKLFFALAVVVLLVSTAQTASAQGALSCVASAAPAIVRSEGLAENLGDVVLNCTGTAGAAQYYNIQLTLNTNVTNQNNLGTASASDSVLLLGGALTNTLNVDIFQGSVSGQSILFRAIPVTPPGTTLSIRITNIRGNASQFNGVAGATITAFVSTQVALNTTTPLPITNALLTIGSPQQGLAFRVREANSSTSGLPSAGYVNQLQCADNNKDLASDATKSGVLTFTMQFREQQIFAFKKASEEVGYTNAAVGGGLASATSGALGGGLYTSSGLGAVSNGTRLRATFSNVPAGVTLYVTTKDIGSPQPQGTNGLFGAPGTRAILVATDANGDGAPVSSSGSGGGAAVATTANPPAGTNGTTYPIAPVTITAGTGVAVWEVISDDPSNAEDFTMGVVVAFKAGAASLGTISVAGSFAPVSSDKGAETLSANPSSSAAPIPRFIDTGTASTADAVVSCQTNILLPFVTNQLGFDTGIIISNTSQDPFGTAGQAGTCILNYYGQTTGGGAAPPAQTTQSIAAGGEAAFTLSSGGNLGITATPGFQGYMIVQCNFRFAHMFIFVSDLGAKNLAMGYLGLILDASVGSRTTSAAETLTQ